MEHDEERLIVERIKQAMESEDNNTLLEMLNEYIGLLRELGRKDESYAIAERIKNLLELMDLKDTIPYATSYLNIATAYRMGGAFDASYACYDVAENVYKKLLSPDSELFASLYNNKALLLQEAGRINESIDYLKKALAIVEALSLEYESAVSHANLANSYLALGMNREAVTEALTAKGLFESSGDMDTHYASALYVLGLSLSSEEKKEEAADYLKTALDIMERELGKNEFYKRIKEEYEKLTGKVSGLNLARSLYEECFAPVIEKDFAEYKEKIAVGLVGRGSDCFGFDDEESRDHDWGPGFLIWLNKDTYDAIGEKLEDAYKSLPKEYKGYSIAPIVSSHKRRGVFVIEDFYKDLLGKWPISEDDYIVIPDSAFSTAVNGEVFTDPGGEFTKIRNELKKGYPKSLLYRKIAETASKMCQCGQYNYKRMLKRGDELTASIFKSDCIKEAMRLAILLEGKYPPHDKWLFKTACELDMSDSFIPVLTAVYNGSDPDLLGEYFALTMYSMGYISDTDDYLDHHAAELIFKSSLVSLSHEELVDRITKAEFAAFDEVENEGGRASCQDDFFTFDIMRKSQYLTWKDHMLIQLIYDFEFEGAKGHNLITEKYGRMMESTANDRYQLIKDNFPEISDEKKSIIESIVGIQVSWMEAFAKEYPRLAGKARSIHTYEDGPYNTSYETYLRGEISTYSDKMLQLYGMFIAEYAKNGKNLAYDIMANTVRFYGYNSLEAAK